jgi:hypothetical protein
MKYFLASTHMCVCSNFKYLCIAQLCYEIDIVPSSILRGATLSGLCVDIGERSGTFCSYLKGNKRAKCDVDTEVKAYSTQHKIVIQHILPFWQNVNLEMKRCTIE